MFDTIIPRCNVLHYSRSSQACYPGEHLFRVGSILFAIRTTRRRKNIITRRITTQIALKTHTDIQLTQWQNLYCPSVLTATLPASSYQHNAHHNKPKGPTSWDDYERGMSHVNFICAAAFDLVPLLWKRHDYTVQTCSGDNLKISYTTVRVSGHQCLPPQFTIQSPTNRCSYNTF